MSQKLTYDKPELERHSWPPRSLLHPNKLHLSQQFYVKDHSWSLYGKNINVQTLNLFQQKLQQPLHVLDAWCIEEYQVVHFSGQLPKNVKPLVDEFKWDMATLSPLMPVLSKPGLLLMDMDSTAIKIECIDEIAKLAGVGEQVAAVTERAMRGELDFADSLRQRVATLKGADESLLQQVGKQLPLTPGLEKLITTLQRWGWQVVIASGGFTYFSQILEEKLHLAATFANQLEIKQGRLTGQVVGEIVDAKYKANILLSFAEGLNLPLSQTIAIGDGANDLMMIQQAGLGIAYHAKPKVYAQASQAIRYADLTGVLCLLSANIG